MEILKAVPPVSVSTATVFGVTVQDWLLVLTLIYTVLQIGITVFKFIRARKE